MIYLAVLTILLSFLFFITEKKMITSVVLLIISCVWSIYLYLSPLAGWSKYISIGTILTIGSGLYFYLNLRPIIFDFIYTSKNSSKYKHSKQNVRVLSDYLQFYLSPLGVKLQTKALNCLIPVQPRVHYSITLGIIPDFIYIQFLHETFFIDYDQQNPHPTFAQALKIIKILLNHHIEIEVVLKNKKLIQKSIYSLESSRSPSQTVKLLINQKLYHRGLFSHMINMRPINFNNLKNHSRKVYKNSVILDPPDLEFAQKIF